LYFSVIPPFWGDGRAMKLPADTVRSAQAAALAAKNRAAMEAARPTPTYAPGSLCRVGDPMLRIRLRPFDTPQLPASGRGEILNRPKEFFYGAKSRRAYGGIQLNVPGT
jgi:hypothetical protein